MLQNKTQKKKKKIWLTKLLFTQFHTCKNICFFHRISYINVSIFFVSTDGKIKDLGGKKSGGRIKFLFQGELFLSTCVKLTG